MLAFNDLEPGGILTYGALKTISGLVDNELKRTLQSLACAKSRVLLKAPKGREVGPDDKFRVNLDFSSPHVRVKINQIQLEDTPEEVRETHERIDKDRQYETQAAIIRIMKGTKAIKHVELVQKVIANTSPRGNLDLEMIKLSIEK